MSLISRLVMLAMLALVLARPPPPVQTADESPEPVRYSQCMRKLGVSGWARYPGWTLVGDDLSGALPIASSVDCTKACHNYGTACTGVVYDEDRHKCYFKGTSLEKWLIQPSEAESLHLIGGCAFWADNQMNQICCES